MSHLPGGHLPPPKFGHLPPPNSDISHPPKKTFARRTTATPNFFFLFLAYFSWLFRLTAHEGHQGWEEGGAWWGGHGAHQVGGGYHGGHGGRHGGGKVGWALCFCSWQLGSHISKEGGRGSYPLFRQNQQSRIWCCQMFLVCVLWRLIFMLELPFQDLNNDV